MFPPKTFDERAKYIKHCENVHKKGLGEKNYKCHIWAAYVYTIP